MITLTAGVLVASTADASLISFQTFNGNVGLSTDGFGSTSNNGVISANTEAGSTVLGAYLYSSTFFTADTPAVSLNGNSVSFGPRVANDTACCSLASFRADVTSIVAPVIDGGAGGTVDFVYEETGLGNNTDGSALVVVYENPALPESTIGILDGFASVTGDSAFIDFASPLDPNDPDFFAKMVLGIGFSALDQASEVLVNGTLLTQVAGDNDDSPDPFQANGNLITVGSFDDPVSPINGARSEDHEVYDLIPFITTGDTQIVVDTFNASQDDNIFLAAFHVNGEATITTAPPTSVSEPATLSLLGFGFAGLGLSLMRRRRRER